MRGDLLVDAMSEHFSCDWCQMSGHCDLPVDAMIERAHQYRRGYFARYGSPPERFVVSAQEYRCLQMYYGRPSAVDWSCELQLFGMRVVQEASLFWPPLTVLGRPLVDSETTSMDEWEAGVLGMIADVKRRRGLPVDD